LLGLKIVTTWLEVVSGYLPNLLAAALVGVIGFGAAVMLRDAMKNSFQGTQMERLSRIAYWFVVVVTLFLMAGQLKFDIQILTLSAVVVLGTTLGGAALAFGLGARLIVANILSTHYLSKIYKIGDQVEIDQIQGVVMEINPVAVILTTDKGNAVVPSKEFLEKASIMNRTS
jgi:small-conductance mechanosensitive channel